MWSTYGTDGPPAGQINLQQTPLTERTTPSCQQAPQLNSPAVCHTLLQITSIFTGDTRWAWTLVLISFWHSNRELLLCATTDTVGSEGFLIHTMFHPEWTWGAHFQSSGVCRIFSTAGCKLDHNVLIYSPQSDFSCWYKHCNTRLMTQLLCFKSYVNVTAWMDWSSFTGDADTSRPDHLWADAGKLVCVRA